MARTFKGRHGEGWGMDKEKVPLPEIDLGSFIKDVAWAALVKLATARLIAALPFLGFGPLGWITGAVVAMVGSAVYDSMAEAFNLTHISFKNEAAQRAYDTASVKLKLIARDFGIESEEFKTLRAENVKALSALIKFDAASRV